MKETRYMFVNGVLLRIVAGTGTLSSGEDILMVRISFCDLEGNPITLDNGLPHLEFLENYLWRNWLKDGFIYYRD